MAIYGLYIYIYIILPHVHIPDSTRNILRTRIKSGMVVREISTTKITMDTLDLEMVINGEENGCNPKTWTGHTHNLLS